MTDEQCSEFDMQTIADMIQEQFDASDFFCPKCCGISEVKAMVREGIGENDDPFYMRLTCPKCGVFNILTRPGEEGMEYYEEKSQERYYPQMDWSTVKAVEDFRVENYGDPKEACLEFTSRLTTAAQAFYIGDLMAESRKYSDKALEEFKKFAKTDTVMMEKYLEQVCICASFAYEDCDHVSLYNYYKEAIPFAEGVESPKMVSLLLAYGMTLYSSGDGVVEAGKILERGLAMGEKVFKDGTPDDDPLTLVIAYEMMSYLKQDAADRTAAMRYAAKALDEWKKQMPRVEVDYERLYGLSECYHLNLNLMDEKRHKEILDDFVVTASKYKDEYSTFYAEALITRYGYIYGMKEGPGSTEDLDAIIDMFDETEDPEERVYLSKALFFRSTCYGEDKIKDILADLSLALSALMANLRDGYDPDDLFKAVAKSYLSRLKANDKSMYKTVKKSLESFGITEESLDRWVAGEDDILSGL